MIDRREGDAEVDESLNPSRELGLRGHAEGHVIEPRMAPGDGGAGAGDQHDQRAVRRAKREAGTFGGTADQPDDAGPEGLGTVKVGDRKGQRLPGQPFGQVLGGPLPGQRKRLGVHVFLLAAEAQARGAIGALRARPQRTNTASVT